MKTKASILLGAALSLLMTLTTAHAAGKGKGGGGGPRSTPESTIYYYGNFPGWNGNPSISMNADGSNKTVLGSGGWSDIFGEPSINLHNNHRWFVKVRSMRDPTPEDPINYLEYPDGSHRYQLITMRDDCNPTAFTPETGAVLLDGDPAFQLMGGTHWLLGDDFISVVARRWSSGDPGATVVEGGIYVLPLVFAADGTIIGLGELPTTPTIPLPLVPYDGPNYDGVEHPRPDVNIYSWAPTASKYVYQKLGDPYGVWVADVDGTEKMISSHPGHNPQWSPDGHTIAYGAGGGLVTIMPNGNGLTWILQPTSEWEFYYAYWSPDSNYLVFTGQSKLEYNHDIFKCHVSGLLLENLTDTPGPSTERTFGGNAGWR